MHPAAVAVLLASVAAAAPAGLLPGPPTWIPGLPLAYTFPEDSGPIDITFGKPAEPAQAATAAPTTAAAAPETGWPSSVSKLFQAGTDYIQGQRKDWASQNFSVYTISASTSSNASTSSKQQDFTQMQIQYLAPNSTKINVITNYGSESGNDDGPGPWTGPQVYTISAATLKEARPWPASISWNSSLSKVATVLKNKNLTGPWDDVSISLPELIPGPNPTTNNNTLWVEVSGHTNDTVSYIACDYGRIFRSTND